MPLLARVPTGGSARCAGLVVGLAQVVGTLMAVALVERAGHRPILVGGAALMLAANMSAALITGLAFDSYPISEGAGAGVAVSLAIF